LEPQISTLFAPVKRCETDNINMKSFLYIAGIVFLLFNFSCAKPPEPTKNKDTCYSLGFFSGYASRNFKMGFTTWPFGPNPQDVTDTYQFIHNYGDIYCEHIDSKIPWNAWINNLPLPSEFTNEISNKLAKRLNDRPLLLSISLLNANRSDLAEDFDGTILSYINLNDNKIEEAYFKHLKYLINAFNPDYLVMAIEVNELLLRKPNKWTSYKLLIKHVKARIKQIYPDLKISESISLHNLYKANVTNSSDYINELINYINQMDFVSFSYYPYLKNQHSKLEFQKNLDFLNNNIHKPIAFVETSHLAENLSIPNLNIDINGNECEQNIYLKTLLTNAQEHHYLFVIWWTHRDYDALWETFPPEIKDLGQIWRNTGLLDKNGKKRLSFTTWVNALHK